MTDAAEVASMKDVTDLHRPADGRADAAADRAAAAAGVLVREISDSTSCATVYRLYDGSGGPTRTTRRSRPSCCAR